MRKDQYWYFETGGDSFQGTGPVELMQEACKVAGVKLKCPRQNEWFNDGNGWRQAATDWKTLQFVIPSSPEPCPNCQNAKGIHLIESSRKINGEWICYHCNRPESEWTYDKDIEWAGIGSGIM